VGCLGVPPYPSFLIRNLCSLIAIDQWNSFGAQESWGNYRCLSAPINHTVPKSNHRAPQ